MPAFDISEIEALAGPARGTGAILSEIRGVRGESPLVALGEQLKQREEEVRGQRQSLGETLMRLGLGMAASRRSDFLGAVGEGGLSALQGYVQNRDFTRKEAADLLRQRMAVEAQRQQGDDVLFREAGELARSEQYGRVSTIQAIQAARNTALTANTAAEREEARNRANALLAKYEADEKRAAANAENIFRAGESEKERKSREAIAKIRADGAGRGGSAGIELDDRIKLLNSTISQNNSMLESLYKRMQTAPADQQEAIRKNIAELESRGRQLSAGAALLLNRMELIGEDVYEPPPASTTNQQQPKSAGSSAPRAAEPAVAGEAITPEQRQSIMGRFAALDRPTETMRQVRGIQQIQDIINAGQRISSGVQQPRVGASPGYYPSSLVDFIRGGQ
jgi:hypothetical protein